MKTTLNQIREHSPCAEGWEKLLRTLGKTKADDEPVSITQVLDSNGLEDALWCLRAVAGCDREIRLFAVWCARQVEHLMSDERSKQALVCAKAIVPAFAQQEGAALDERAAFEADMLELYPAVTFGRYPSGRYNLSWVADRWDGWRRRAALTKGQK